MAIAELTDPFCSSTRKSRVCLRQFHDVQLQLGEHHVIALGAIQRHRRVAWFTYRADETGSGGVENLVRRFAARLARVLPVKGTKHGDPDDDLSKPGNTG